MEITREVAQKVLNTVNAGLVKGLGHPIPGQMCVEAAVCFAMGLPHGDSPPCVSPALRGLKISLNDAGWSSKSVRANGLRELALLQLGTDGVLDEVEFAKKVILLVINKYLPPMLRKINLNQEAEACEQAKDLDTARAAAWVAAAAATNAAVLAIVDAADADATARAAWVVAAAATNAAALAIVDAADAIRSLSRSDDTLLSFAKDVAEILIDMKVPGVQWLGLLVTNTYEVSP
jgi:hypothetical protein